MSPLSLLQISRKSLDSATLLSLAAATCAVEGGEFWEMCPLLFEAQARLALDVNRCGVCANSRQAVEGGMLKHIAGFQIELKRINF